MKIIIRAANTPQAHVGGTTTGTEVHRLYWLFPASHSVRLGNYVNTLAHQARQGVRG